MKLYAIYTDSHKILKDRWFLKTMKDKWDLNAIYLGSGGGRFGGLDFFNIVSVRKTEHIIKSIEENPDDIVIWSDVDIQFFGRCAGIIEKSIEKKEIVFQRERLCRDTVNPGFFAMRCNKKTLALWRHVLDFSKRNIRDFGSSRLPLGEMTFINETLRRRMFDINWGMFPDTIWAWSCGFEPPAGIKLHHANCAGDIDSKIKQLQKVRDIVSSPAKMLISECKRRARILRTRVLPNARIT